MSSEGSSNYPLLKEVDIWLSRLKPRWTDLMGDYAGEEFFVVDADSLCQKVLEDELVAIGQNEPNFQILHGIYCLEQAVLDLKRGGCNFEIVFFECNKHGTLLTGSDPFVSSSRFLAREIMKSHILQLTADGKVGSAVFEDLKDSRWGAYVKDKRPMFVLYHTGPSLDLVKPNDFYAIARVVIQRSFIRDLLAARFGVATANQMEYVDSKASDTLAFVYERQRASDANRGAPKRWSKVAMSSMTACNKHFKGDLRSLDFPKLAASKTREDWLMEAAKNMLTTSTNTLDITLVFLFVGAQLSLPSLSLSQRVQHPCRMDLALRSHLLSRFCPSMFRHLACILGNTSFLADLDGAIFLVVLNCVVGILDPSPEKVFGNILARNVTRLWSSAKLPAPDLSILSQCYSHVPTPVHSSHDDPAKLKLLPFSHPVLDKYLPSFGADDQIELESVRSSTRIQRLCDAPFAEDRHWHNTKAILPKHLGGRDDTTPTATSWERMKQQRRDQLFMANSMSRRLSVLRQLTKTPDSVHRHAQTLTGAKGQPIKRIIIGEVSVPAPATGGVSTKGKQRPSISKAPSVSKPAKGSKSHAPQLTSAQKLRAKIEVEKQSKKSSEDDIWWKSQLTEIKGIGDVHGCLNQVNSILRGKRAETGWLAVEVRLIRIHLTIHAWISHEQSKSEAVCEGYTVRILRYINELRGHPSLYPAAANILAHVLEVLGFASITPPMANSQENRSLSFTFVKLSQGTSGKLIHPHLHIKLSPTEFQLKAFGAFMDRSMDGKPDPRVTFEPDGWQREVLDKVDRNESVLVIAPTSAGKTFSSFYAMEKVLRESNDGVIVYVSPTKALCQQIAADVYARFSKDVKGRTVWAIHTRDFRIHDPLGAQILVTVPEVLSTMLLSPSMAKVWVPHLKYIILDEIHSIGQYEAGQVWEHIILLSRCPILGLSATIGKPEVFGNWLGSVQKEHNQEYSIVEHKYRYSHLRKYFWKAPNTERGGNFKGLLSPPPDDSHLHALHPMSALLGGGNAMPPDLALESQDCLSLYSMMKNCVPSGSQRLTHLNPDVFFADKRHELLKQLDVIRYEEALKDLVSDWAQARDSGRPESPYQNLLVALRADMNRDGSLEPMLDSRSDKDAAKNFIQLLHKLDYDNDLPCLAFNFDRSSCENLAKSLLETLEKGERSWRKSNPLWKEKLKQWEDWKLTTKLRQRAAERANRQRPEDQAESSSATWQSTFDPNDPSREFSFANTKCEYSREEFQKDTAPSRWQSHYWPPWLVRALQRGIAVHHAGMPKAYRSLVESLFRLGYCRVMISTGTLALGINAPAKSVVFVGDSHYLTALMYRQCAGRAGRRGFDLLGKVIFYNLPIDRVQRLMLSRIPPLNGNWPLTTTLCLRLFHLLTESDQAPSAVGAVDSLMRLPQLSTSSEQTKQEVLHHMRFSIEYLRRLRLLSDTGRTTALFSAVGHLYYEEPGNLAFAALVRSGIIHRICSKFRTNKRETEKDIVHLVATLFARLPLPQFIESREVLTRLRTTLPSLIKLPPLPDYILRALEQHNKDTLRIFKAYTVSYAQQHLRDTPDNTLPLSQCQIYRGVELAAGVMRDALEATSIKNCVASSPFVSNSGKGDEFQSIPKLHRSTRAGLHLATKSIPNFNYNAPVNAYALDYWQHGSVRPLIEANGLRAGEVWFILENFSKTLQSLVASLQVILIDRVAAEHEISEAEGALIEDSDDGGDERAYRQERPDKIPTIPVRPEEIPQEDWIVYEAFQSVNTTFYEKWRKMWA